MTSPARVLTARRAVQAHYFSANQHAGWMNPSPVPRRDICARSLYEPVDVVAVLAQGCLPRAAGRRCRPGPDRRTTTHARRRPASTQVGASHWKAWRGAMASVVISGADGWPRATTLMICAPMRRPKVLEGTTSIKCGCAGARGAAATSSVFMAISRSTPRNESAAAAKRSTSSRTTASTGMTAVQASWSASATTTATPVVVRERATAGPVRPEPLQHPKTDQGAQPFLRVVHRRKQRLRDLHRGQHAVLGEPVEQDAIPVG